MTTLREIADAADVSVGTVSKILNGKIQGGANAAARVERVQGIARKLGYRPNEAARSMQSGKFNMMALLNDANGQRTCLPRELLDGVMGVLSEHSLRLNVTQLHDLKLDVSDDRPDLLQQAAVDGVIVNYHGTLPQGLEYLLQHANLPAVWLNTDRPWDCVRPDDHLAGVEATEALLQAGHTRVAYMDLKLDLPTEIEHHYSRRDRLAGYRSAMESAGIPSRVVKVDTHFAGAAAQREWMRQMLKSPDAPTALVAYSQDDATCAIMVSTDANRPAVVTFGNLPLMSGYQFATVLIPWEEIGRRAATMLEEKVADPRHQLPCLTIPCVLDPGETIIPY